MTSYTPRDRTAVLAALDGVAPLIRAHAAEADRAGRFPDVVVGAMKAAGLMRLWVPRSIGGDELALPDALAVFEAASALDGGAGWLVTIGTGGNLFAATMEPEFAREVYGPQNALIAGSGMPSGTATPVSTPEGGGYRIDGRWRYASGACHATWFTANTLVEDGSQERLMRAVAIPAPRVQVHETWDTLGMRATNSHDFSVAGEFVPEAHTFNVFGEPHEDGQLYRFPFMSIAQTSFAAVALGIARHGIEAFRASASEERLERNTVRGRLAEAEASLASARDRFFEAAERTWAKVEAGDALDEDEQAAVHLASADANASAVGAVESLYLVAGMEPLFAASEFGRCWRDVHTVSQHSALTPAH